MEGSELTRIIFLIAIGMLVLVVFVLFTMYESSKRINNEKLRREQLEVQHKKELLEHTLRTIEKERVRFSREIHDSICSKLGIVSLHMYEMEETTSSVKLSKLQITKNILSSAIEDTRRIAHDLFPVILEKFGLITAIEELCEINESETLKLQFHSEFEDREFSNNTSTQIYRIIQELVNNSLKYAQCSNIRIELAKNSEKYTLVYADNGIGNKNELQRKSGMGFMNIRSRLDSIQGEMVIEDAHPGLSFFIHFKKHHT